MEKYGLQFHHIGLALKNPDQAAHFLKGLGYTIGEIIHDHLQGVNLIMCSCETMPAIEIIFPDGNSGPLDNLLASRDQMIYHICYTSLNLEKSLKKLKDDKNRVICVSPAKPAILFDNKLVSFFMIKGFGLIEIIESKKNS